MRIAVWLVLLSGCASSPRAPAPAPAAPPAAARPAWSEQTFDDNVRAKLAARYPGAAITKLDGDTFRVMDFEVRFVKALAVCRDDWSRCEAAVDHTLVAIDEARRELAGAIAPAQLRVILRAKAKLAGAQRAPAVQPFASDALWVLAADSPNTIRYVDADAVGALGLTVDDAWKRAIANTKPANVVTQASDWAVVYQDDYAPSALQFPALLEAAVRAHLPGKTGTLLAVCPEETIALFTLGGAPEVAALRQVAEAGAAESVSPLSTRVMAWRDGGWHEVP